MSRLLRVGSAEPSVPDESWLPWAHALRFFRVASVLPTCNYVTIREPIRA
jgi:hypothetical protein